MASHPTVVFFSASTATSVGAMKRTAVLGFLIGVANVFGDYFCPTVVSRGAVLGTSCYEFIADEANWTSARARCHARGGRLAYIGNRETQSWLSARAEQEFPYRQGVWLGLNDRTEEGTYVWDNYRTLASLKGSYFYWDAGEPNDYRMPGNQDCVYMRKSYQWKWVDVDCESRFRTYSSICEYEAIGLRWSSHDPFTPLSTLPTVTKRVSTTELAKDRTKDDRWPLTTQDYTSASATANMRHVSTATYAKGSTQDYEWSSTTQEYVRAAAEPFRDIKTEGLAASFTDRDHLQLLYATGAVVLIIVASVVALVFWRHRRRAIMNATAAVALNTPTPEDATAQPKETHCPLEWQSPMKAEDEAPCEISLKQKKVDRPSESWRSSSGNIYVDIDALACREPTAVSSLIIGQADAKRAALSNCDADAEVVALPPAPPPPLPLLSSRLQVTAAVFNPASDLHAAAAADASGKKSADVAVEIEGRLVLQAPIELAVVNCAAAGQAVEGYLEFRSGRTSRVTSTIPTA